MNDIRLEPIVEYDTPAYTPRKKRFGDRKDGRRLRTISAMNMFQPFIMEQRNDSQNQFEDVIDITNVEKYFLRSLLLKTLSKDGHVSETIPNKYLFFRNS